MQLVAFRIQNYRSIIDSEWQYLSPDNLTTIVGQNESGKSAVLDALMAFHTTKIDDDSLRNDDSFPIVSCRFRTTKEEIRSIFSEAESPRGLFSRLDEKEYLLDLTRTWTSLDDHKLELDDDDLRELLVTHEVNAKAKYQAALDGEAAQHALPDEVLALEEELKEAEADGPSLPASSSQSETEPAGAAEEDTLEMQSVTDSIPEPSVISWEQFCKDLYGLAPQFVKFVDEASFLPETIDLDAIVKRKTTAAGYVGTKNFLALAGLTTDDIQIDSHRRSGGKIRTANKRITADFHDFWRQVIGGSGAKAQIEVELKHYPSKSTPKSRAGEPYLVFWVKNGEELLHPHQRSTGLQWFLSFFLQLRAAELATSKRQILLIDEPGQNLHIEAQKDILKVFEKSKTSIQIMYTTHSPHLITANALHRVLAVQRSDDGDVGETEVLSARKLVRAKTDTLLPIFAVIGADISNQNVIERQDNVLLEEPSAFYYLSAFKKMVGHEKPMHFLPAMGATNVRTYVNLFLGWGLDFLAVFDDDQTGRAQVKLIEDEVYGGRGDESNRHIMKLDGCDGIEDVFSRTDFKRHVLQSSSAKYLDRHESNSAYAKRESLQKLLLAIEFSQHVEEGKFTISDFSTTTQEKIKSILDTISGKLEDITVYSGSRTKS